MAHIDGETESESVSMTRIALRTKSPTKVDEHRGGDVRARSDPQPLLRVLDARTRRGTLENAMRISLLAAVAALTLATLAAAQTSTDLPMPVAPAGLGERITSGVQTDEPAPLAAAYGLATSQLTAAQIRQIQQGLRAQGIPLRRIDGRFGPETAGAVQSFEQRHNIASVTGQIDARTLSLLGVGVMPNQPRVGAPGTRAP
jgi:hypothetical protein